MADSTTTPTPPAGQCHHRPTHHNKIYETNIEIDREMEQAPAGWLSGRPRSRLGSGVIDQSQFRQRLKFHDRVQCGDHSLASPHTQLEFLVVLALQ
jgi:hypothetical protein